MAISAVMIAATVGGTVLDILYEDDGETETMYQAFQKDKAYQKALEGKIIDQELLEEIKKTLIPIQTGEAEAKPLFCPTMDEVDEYCDQQLLEDDL